MDIMQMFRNVVGGGSGGQPPQQPGQMGVNPGMAGNAMNGVPPQQQQPNMPTGASSNPGVTHPNNPVDPNPQQGQSGTQSKSPEVDFKDLWNIDPKTNPQPADLAEFNFTFDPKKVQEHVSQMDFTRSISPDQIKKIAAGGEESISALMSVMNSVAQQATHAALIGSAKITETSLQTTGQRIKDNLPTLIRSQSVSNALREDNPLFENPAFSPLMEVVGSQMAQKFPQATAAELREYTKKYMSEFVQGAGKFMDPDGGTKPNAAQSAKVTDFSSWG